VRSLSRSGRRRRRIRSLSSLLLLVSTLLRGWERAKALETRRLRRRRSGEDGLLLSVESDGVFVGVFRSGENRREAGPGSVGRRPRRESWVGRRGAGGERRGGGGNVGLVGGGGEMSAVVLRVRVKFGVRVVRRSIPFVRRRSPGSGTGRGGLARGGSLASVIAVVVAFLATLRSPSLLPLLSTGRLPLRRTSQPPDHSSPFLLQPPGLSRRDGDENADRIKFRAICADVKAVAADFSSTTVRASPRDLRERRKKRRRSV